MNSKAIKRFLCAAMAAALLMPAALGEPSDDVSGYNPFDGSYIEASPTASPVLSTNSGNPFVESNTANTGTQLTADDLFGNNSTFDTGAASTNTASDPFGLNDDSTGATNDPFGVGGDSTGAVNDPFGVAATPQPTATAKPVSTVSGYNPFAANTETAVVIPTNEVMYVTESSVKLRGKAVENARVIGTVYFGQQLTVTGTQGDWAQVQNTNGATGYCLLSALSNANPNTMNKLMYVQVASAPLYRAPSQKMGRYRNVKKGDTVTMVAITSDGLWSRVTDGTNYGFIPTIYLDDTPSAQGTQVWCMSGSTAVMVNPEAWIQITTLSFGQSAFLVGYTSNNTVAKIRSAKGYVAYCDASALTTADPATLNTRVYVQATGKVLRTAIGGNGKLLNVNKNNQFILLGVDNSQQWALVRQGKTKRYIPYVFIGADRQGQNYRVVVTNQDAALYNSASATSGLLGTLPIGTRVNLIGGTGDFAQVATISDGVTPATTGYVELQYLRGE